MALISYSRLLFMALFNLYMVEKTHSLLLCYLHKEYTLSRPLIDLIGCAAKIFGGIQLYRVILQQMNLHRGFVFLEDTLRQKQRSKHKISAT